MTDDKQNYDYGIAVLRVFMCFEVVLIHYLKQRMNFTGSGMIAYLRQFAVPVFMVLSFLLTQKKLGGVNREWLAGRTTRLLVPQIGWTITYFLVYSLFDFVFHTEFTEPHDFWWQLATGHSLGLNPTMWFQVVLIWMTVLFVVIVIVFPEKMVIPILICLSGIALIIEYTGAIMALDSYRFEIKYPVGRMVAMIPLAATGYSMACYGVFQRVKKNRIATFLAALLLIVLDCKWSLFKPVDGFGYTGLQAVVISIALLALMESLPFERLGKLMKRIIKAAARFTLGIYCVHRLIGTIIESIINHWSLPIPAGTLAECFLVYVISYLLCLIGYKLFKNTILRMMFD